MKKMKLSESEIVLLLKEGEAGLVTVVDLCRKYKISEATYYKLKARYSGISTSELKRMRQLEVENNRLKKMYADLSLEHKLIQEAVEKKYPGLIAKSWPKS